MNETSLSMKCTEVSEGIDISQLGELASNSSVPSVFREYFRVAAENMLGMSGLLDKEPDIGDVVFLLSRPSKQGWFCDNVDDCETDFMADGEDWESCDSEMMTVSTDFRLDMLLTEQEVERRQGGLRGVQGDWARQR